MLQTPLLANNSSFSLTIQAAGRESSKIHCINSYLFLRQAFHLLKCLIVFSVSLTYKWHTVGVLSASLRLAIERKGRFVGSMLLPEPNRTEFHKIWIAWLNMCRSNEVVKDSHNSNTSHFYLSMYQHYFIIINSTGLLFSNEKETGLPQTRARRLVENMCWCSDSSMNRIPWNN